MTVLSELNTRNFLFTKYRLLLFLWLYFFLLCLLNLLFVLFYLETGSGYMSQTSPPKKITTILTFSSLLFVSAQDYWVYKKFSTTQRLFCSWTCHSPMALLFVLNICSKYPTTIFCPFYTSLLDMNISRKLSKYFMKIQQMSILKI